VLKSSYYERVMPGDSVALVRAGNLRSDVGHRHGEHDVCAGRNRSQGRSRRREANARA
jgi:hypothetical protein